MTTPGTALPWQRIASADNPKLKHLLRLLGDNHRVKQEQLAVMEGLHGLDAVLDHLNGQQHHASVALEQLVAPDALLQHPEWPSAQAKLCGCFGHAWAPVPSLWQVPDPLYKKLSTQTTPTGPLLVLRVLPCARPLSTQHDVLVLDGVQDPGNVGTLVRTAAAVGVRQLVCSPDTAWLWSSKALRAGMGAQFAMHCFPEQDLLKSLDSMPVRITSLAPHPLRAELFQADLTAPGIWVFGHEGQGVRAAWQQRATQHVYIPQSPWVESLNVAASAAVCLYEQWRQRRS